MSDREIVRYQDSFVNDDETSEFVLKILPMGPPPTTSIGINDQLRARSQNHCPRGFFEDIRRPDRLNINGYSICQGGDFVGLGI